MQHESPSIDAYPEGPACENPNFAGEWRQGSTGPIAPVDDVMLYSVFRDVTYFYVSRSTHIDPRPGGPSYLLGLYTARFRARAQSHRYYPQLRPGD